MWILVQKGFDLPIVAETEQEAIDLLKKFNDDSCEGAATVTPATVETFHGGVVVDVKVIYVLDRALGFDEDDPLAVAYEYSYGNQVW